MKSLRENINLYTIVSSKNIKTFRRHNKDLFDIMKEYLLDSLQSVNKVILASH